MNHFQIPSRAAAGALCLSFMLSLAACNSTGTGALNTRSGVDKLAQIERLEQEHFGRADNVADVDVLAMTDEMKAYADRYLREFKNQQDRVQMLRYVIIHAGLLGFQYDQTKTRTAREAFELRTGNCLSLSNLYVAMARYMGLDARFQEVSLGNTWTKSDDLYLLNRHINVKGRLRGGGSYVMDFIHIDTEYVPGVQVVSDLRAKAQYYNNLGAEHLREGNNTAALVYFKKAIATDPDIDYIWSNLGTAYSRSGDLIAAEAAYRVSLDLNSSNWSAINNLAVLYQKLGRVDEARRQLAGIERFRLKNPYYRLQLSERAYQEGRYRRAISHLKKAIAMKPGEHEFYFALAKSYYRLGDLDSAQRNFDKARALAASDAERERYRVSLDALLEDKDSEGKS